MAGRIMKHAVTILRHLYGERPGLLIGGAALSAAAALAGVALLGLSGWFVTAAGLAGASFATAKGFDIFAPSAGIRLLALTRTATRYGERLVTHDATLAALAAMRERLFRSTATPGAARHLLARPARLLFRLTADVDALDALYLRVLVPAAVAVLGALVLGIGFALVNPWLGLGTALFLLLVGLGIPAVATRCSRRALRRRTHALEALRARTVDLSAGQTDWLMAGRLPAAGDAVMTAEHRLAQADDTVNRIDAATQCAFGAAGAVVLAGALVTAAALTGDGSIEAPTAALIVLATFAALEPFAALRRGALELARAMLAAGRIAPRLDRPNTTSPSSLPPPTAGFAVALQGVAVHAPDTERILLSAVSLTIPAGEHVAVIGISGAGKSTLLAAMAGEVTVAAGQVHALPSATMTQRADLFQDSVRDNLRLAAPHADDAALWQALHAAGLADVVAALPGGLDARLGEGGSGLSAGQGRRLALARLLLHDAPLWLLDEPTESLDGPTARDLLIRLKTLAAGRTLVIATHTRREAALADRLAVVTDGRQQAVWRRGEPGFTAALTALRPD